MFIGSEIYSGNVIVGFLITGWVPRDILTRIKRIQSSGIWKWWAMLARAVLDEDRKTLPKPATMGGNIALVFILLVSGLIVAIILFILEAMFDKLSVSVANLSGFTFAC